MMQQPKTGAVTLRDYKQRMLRVLLHIQDHLDDNLALDKLAAIACFSPYHFHRVFRGMIGSPSWAISGACVWNAPRLSSRPA